jgi:hypothetical protein
VVRETGDAYVELLVGQAESQIVGHAAERRARRPLGFAEGGRRCRGHGAGLYTC